MENSRPLAVVGTITITEGKNRQIRRMMTR